MNLVLDRVTVEEGARPLLADASLRFEETDFIALVGPNGAGKSTLLRAALGVVRPTAGEVLLGGDSVRSLRGRERAARISWLPQRASFQEPIEVLDFVCSGRFRFDEPLSVARAAARRSLERVGAAAFAEREFTTLSGGEQQRVALASLLAQEAPLLVLDEPAAHLDPRQQLEVHSLLVEIWREGRGILCATHDINLLAHALEPSEAERVRVIGLRQGRQLFSCSYDSPELGAHLSDLFDVKMRLVAVEGHRYFLGQPGRVGAA